MADLRLEEAVGMVSGANRNDCHVMGLEFGRDVEPDEYVDLRMVKPGEGCPDCGGPLRVLKAIELGHIFKLGTKYASAMRATYLDESGCERPIVMGSYGIGIGRILAAAIEGSADASGIRWNSALSPLDAMVLPLNIGDEAVLTQANKLYESLSAGGLKVLIDDRDASPGVKMMDADLSGVPAQVIVSPRNIGKGTVEIKNRWNDKRSFVPPQEVEKTVRGILRECLPRVKG